MAWRERDAPVTLAIHELGLDLTERHGFQLVDAMIAAAALDSGCEVLWSEDMHDGLVVDGQPTIRVGVQQPRREQACLAHPFSQAIDDIRICNDLLKGPCCLQAAQ